MRFALTLALVILTFSIYAQHADSVVQIPGKYLSSIDKKQEN